MGRGAREREEKVSSRFRENSSFVILCVCVYIFVKNFNLVLSV